MRVRELWNFLLVRVLKKAFPHPSFSPLEKQDTVRPAVLLPFLALVMLIFFYSENFNSQNERNFSSLESVCFYICSTPL